MSAKGKRTRKIREGIDRERLYPLTDAVRLCHPEADVYTFWDYQAGAFQKDNGIRIDHLLLSPQAADRLTESEIDKRPRGKEKASDHTPIWCGLAAPHFAKAAA